MQKLIYFIHLLCFLFALQSTAAEPAVTTTLLQTGAMAVTLSNAVVDDVMSDDFGNASCCVDMLEIAEVDVDKILCPAFNYPLPQTTHLKPEPRLPEYRLQVSFWLYRPPQLT